eukprot:3165457-Pyramimonas_sp.AAC.1
MVRVGRACLPVLLALSRKVPCPPARLGGRCHHDGQLGSLGNPATMSILGESRTSSLARPCPLHFR